MKLIVYDVETSGMGFSKIYEQVIEAFAIKIDYDSFMDHSWKRDKTKFKIYHSYYIPKIPKINPVAQSLHKLSMEFLQKNKNEYIYFEKDRNFIDFITKDNALIVAHNAKFEKKSLEHINKDFEFFCTMENSKRFVKALDKNNNIKNPKLEEAARYYNLSFDKESLHSAKDDVRLTIKLLEALVFREKVELLPNKNKKIVLDNNNLLFDTKRYFRIS